MSFNSITNLIVAERSACKISGQVCGTPRTYADRRNDDFWRAQICAGHWGGIQAVSETFDSPVFITFSFRVNPKSANYYRNVSPNGPDLDTMVIGALGGITTGTDRPSLRLLRRASNCWGYAATKQLVADDRDTGVDITISARPVPTLADFRALLPTPNLSFKVLRGKIRQAMAKCAVEKDNTQQRVFPACTPISMSIAFSARGQPRNITSADQIEALIDGMGAAIVGERRFFDAPKGRFTKERYGFDDSCINSLLVGRFDFQDAEIDAIVDIFADGAA